MVLVGCLTCKGGQASYWHHECKTMKTVTTEKNFEKLPSDGLYAFEIKIPESCVAVGRNSTLVLKPENEQDLRKLLKSLQDCISGVKRHLSKLPAESWKDFDTDNMPFVKMNMVAYEEPDAEEGKRHFFSAALPRDKFEVELLTGEVDSKNQPVIHITIYHKLFCDAQIISECTCKR